MAKEWQQGICNEQSGFLFNHDCDKPPVASCDMCDRPICESHSHKDGAAVGCTSCVKKEKERTRRYEDTGRSGWDGRDHDYDPYFYSGYYYGYGYHHGFGYDHGIGMHHHDPFDFTEADAAGLTEDGDDEFESDMSAS